MNSVGVFLSKSDSLRFQLVNKYLNGKINRVETAKLLKISERTVSRLASGVKKKGFWGVKNGNLGKTAPNAYPAEVRQLVIDLFVERYFDYNAKHFAEMLEKQHGLKLSHITVWRWLKAASLVKKPRKRRRTKRTYRDRMPQEGLLLQMDGSHHRWNGKDEWCLISAIDDATSEVPYAEFFKGETTIGCMKILKRIIELKGVPRAIYTDRAGWGGGGKRTEFSQFQRACEKLGIQMIYANSPQAKGRIERSFRTFQDRLVPELRSRKIRSMKEANVYLENEFLAEYWNKKNTVRPMNSESAYCPLDPWIDIDQVLCIEERRVISNDHTIAWKAKRWKVESGRHNFSEFEAVFRTDLNDVTRVFVMEQEVQLKAIQRPQEAVADEVEKESWKVDPMLYRYMWRTAGELRNAVITHLVTGKPLSLSKKRKKVA